MIEDDYELIRTDDGSYSLYSLHFKELMHTSSGAFEESLVKHVYPSRILDSTKNEITILDIGFGLGYNALAVLSEFYSRETKPFINIISLELHESISFWIHKIKFNDNRDLVYNNLKKALVTDGHYKEKWFSFTIIYADARISCRQLLKSGITVDAVFHDAFSPGKNPELWSLDFFKCIYGLMNNQAILTTYSAAPQIRNALIKAGFIIGKGPATREKKESTLASKSNMIHPFDQQYIIALGNDIKATVYRDEMFSLTRDEILRKRIEEMKILRDNHPALQE